MSDTGTDKPVIVLFRHDLRLGDNRALFAASQTGKPVIPVFLRMSGSAAITAPWAAPGDGGCTIRSPPSAPHCRRSVLRLVAPARHEPMR